MKRLFGLSICTALLAVVVAAGTARAHGMGGHHNLVPPIVGHMVSHDQLRSIFQSEKENMQTLHSQLRTAHEQLEDDLVGGKDTTADVQALQTAQNNMLAEKVKIAQQILASLTPAQRTQVAQFMTQWRSLKQQQWQLFQQYGGASEAPQGGSE